MTSTRSLKYVPLDDLKGHPDNPKTHNGALIGASIDRFGYVAPQVLDERTGLLAEGHGRLDELRAKQDAGEDAPGGIRVVKGRWLVPVVHGWSSTDDREALAYLVVSNQSTIAGGWDLPQLGSVLEDIAITDAGLDGIGFNAASLDDLLAEIRATQDGPSPDASEVPEPAEVGTLPSRCRPGDVWQLGPHRILCGDARNPDDVTRLLDGATVNVAFTSPPYADRRKYDETTDFRPIPPDDYVEWFAPVAANVAAHLAEDGSWFVNIKAGADDLSTELYVFDLVIAHAREWGWVFATEFCWERGGMPRQAVRRFKNGFEPVYQFTRGNWKFRPDAVRHASSAAITPGGPGVGNTSWVDPTSNFTTQGEIGGEWFKGRVVEGLAYPSNRLPTFAGSHEATGHMAAFPVGLPAWFCRAYSDESDVVFDPFAGSGSTVLAAHQEGRIGYGMEMSPAYCDIILDRWERHTGQIVEKAQQVEDQPA